MILALLLACPAPEGDTDTPEAASRAIVATTDFAVGQLLVVDRETLEVSDPGVPTSSDPLVVDDDWDGDVLLLLDRGGTDRVRVYRGDLGAPALELGTGEGTNPKDAEVCGDRLFVSLYDRAALAVYDVGGRHVGDVDLAEWADADGLPEAATLHEAGGRLYVGLESLLREGASWQPSGPGRVAEVDCATFEVTRTWETGPNPSLGPDPLGRERLLVRTGVYADADRTLALDGALSWLDPDGDGLSAPFLTEEALGVNVTGVAGADRHGILATTDEDVTSDLRCVDLETGEVGAPFAATDQWYADVVADPEGRAWVAVQPGWQTATAHGLRVFSLPDCAPADGGDLLPTILPPYSLAFDGPSPVAGLNGEAP